MHMNTGTVVSSRIIAIIAGRLGSSSGFSGVLVDLLSPVDIILFINIVGKDLHLTYKPVEITYSHACGIPAKNLRLPIPPLR